MFTSPSTTTNVLLASSVMMMAILLSDSVADGSPVFAIVKKGQEAVERDTSELEGLTDNLWTLHKEKKEGRLVYEKNGNVLVEKKEHGGGYETKTLKEVKSKPTLYEKVPGKKYTYRQRKANSAGAK